MEQSYEDGTSEMDIEAIRNKYCEMPWNQLSLLWISWYIKCDVGTPGLIKYNCKRICNPDKSGKFMAHFV